MTPRTQLESAQARTGLSIPDLETVYDVLADAIDAAGPEKAQLFLVKLALLNANALGQTELFRRHVQAALENL
ncbi:MAG TPA: DUF2783 domain-containing protein [Burkholderiaceae bacterium]|nr:DUF2783 domain-containing protein [Burkholderiaceae bacterium]